MGFAKLERQDHIGALLAAIMIGLVFVIFHLQGNTTHIEFFSRSAILWMTSRWKDAASFGGDYSHGWLIPFVTIGILWSQRSELAAVPKSVSRTGLSVVILALLLHWVGAKAQQTRISLFGLVLLLWGIPFYFYGWQLAKRILFPCAYLIFCIPLNFLDTLTFPLRLMATAISTSMLNGLGIAVVRSGSTIRSLTGGFDFDVADPCSGIRSLLAMTALAAVYAYFTQKTFLKKWILFLMSIPLAIVGNIARIVTVGLVAEAFGEKIATGIYHDYSGYIFFPIAVSLLIAVGGLLNANFTDWKQRWKRELTNTTSS